jgi:hypothetical protein
MLQAPTIHTKHKSQILPKIFVGLERATFDPLNDEHLEAFEMLVYSGRQHQTLRFTLELPYLDVRSMMYDKVARLFLARHKQGQ